MARMSYSLSAGFIKENKITAGMAEEILQEQAQLAKRKIEESARKRLNVKGYSEGITEESFQVKTVKVNRKGDHYLDIAPTGTRPNGKNGKKRKAEVAFLNEFGVPGKNMEAREFITIARDEMEDDLEKIAQKVIDRYLET